MATEVIAVSLRPTDRTRTALARLHRHIGWAGATGLLMMTMSGALVANGLYAKDLYKRSPAESVTGAAPRSGNRSTAPQRSGETEGAPGKPFAASLPRLGEVATLVGQMQQAAVENGLAWPQADYRITPLTDKELARLEVRCVTKGPYPNVRRMVVDLLRTIPGLTVRELAVSRPNPDVSEIEAKMTLAVFLQDAPPSTVQQAPEPQR